jgi:uncharacterized membrane protein YgaE (UPF0421/DUF939 family)
MPVNIKICISVIVALIGLGTFFLEQRFGDIVVGVVTLLLAVFMILSMWIFPDTKGTDNDNQGGCYAGEDR